MNILGLNAFHDDSSAALVRDGILVAAAEEERFRRLKHWAGFPSQSIAYCLRKRASAWPMSITSRSIRTAVLIFYVGSTFC
jgi:predicted NodU family carbamoyl transferase